jgi:hypothetical protein
MTMKCTLDVPEPLVADIRKLVTDEEISLTIVTGADAPVQVAIGPERMESDLSVLRPNGWITCAVARAMSAKLQISISAMGKLLDSLAIKVRRCDLGCF